MEVTRIAVSSCQNKHYLLQMFATERWLFSNLFLIAYWDTTQLGIDKLALVISPLGTSIICGVAQLNVLLAYCGRLSGANLTTLIACETPDGISSFLRLSTYFVNIPGDSLFNLFSCIKYIGDPGPAGMLIEISPFLEAGEIVPHTFCPAIIKGCSVPGQAAKAVKGRAGKRMLSKYFFIFNLIGSH